MNKGILGFILLFVFVAIVSVLMNIAYYKHRNKHLFNKNELKDYEKKLEEFFKNKNIQNNGYIYDIVEKLGYKINECNLSANKEAILDKKNKQIKVNEALGLKAKNFGVAHEIGHMIHNENVDNAARDSHSFFSRSREEQICDYFAAAILLPFDHMKLLINKFNYNNLSRKERQRFIRRIADEKDICEDVVLRRIREVAVLSE